jgi:hypothetical protein
MRTLKTKVEKGSMWTTIGHGLINPKRWGNPLSRAQCTPLTLLNEINLQPQSSHYRPKVYGCVTCSCYIHVYTSWNGIRHGCNIILVGYIAFISYFNLKFVDSI